MPSHAPSPSIEAQIAEWRARLRPRGPLAEADAQAVEQALRAHVVALRGAGLSDDEAMLVALRLVGEPRASIDPARPTWKQHALATTVAGSGDVATRRDAHVVLGLALLAAFAIKAPELFGLTLDGDAGFYARNLSLFVLPILAGYLAWKRGLARTTWLALAAAFIVAGVVANLPSLYTAPQAQALTALHLPIALWLAVGVAYAGGRWSNVKVRMDFVRFSGELLVWYALLALGGIVLVGIMLLLFQMLGLDLEPVLERFILPCGAIGAVIVGAWLVEAKQDVTESIAPVLARLFTPLFAVVLLAWLATTAFTGRALGFERDLVIAFDLLLVVVLGLLLYSISSRDPDGPADAFDLLQVVLVVSALLADALALRAIAVRISEYGFTPNRVAALGENLILLVNLAGSAVLYVRFLRGRGALAALERWQTGFLPIYAAWAAIIVLIFPTVLRA